MAGKSINFNHSDSSITVSDSECLLLSVNGSVKIGNGNNAPEDIINNKDIITMKEYEGTLRFNEETSRLEYCDGTKWMQIQTTSDKDETLTVYSLLF